MKKPYIKILGVLVIAMMLGLIFASVQSSKKFNFKKSAKELHGDLITSDHFIDPNKAKEMMDKKTEDFVFIDLRNPREYDNFHIEGAVNVPVPRILDDEFDPYLKNKKIKILYSDESIEADQIRLLLTQYGYDKLYVLKGGADYWKENMISKNVFEAKGSYEDEKLRFDPEELKKD